MQKFLLSAILFFLVLITFSIFFFFYETKFFGSRASMTQVAVSSDNSYVFVTPLRVKADGQEKARVTVFILSSQGLGVLGKQVSLSNNISVTADSASQTTDSTGKVTFNYSSVTPGEYYLDVHVDDITLSQKAHLTFY